MLRVGLVGAGMIATAHASAYENLQDQVQVVAVADVMPERAKAMGQRFNAEVFPDGETLIEQAEVDVIDVCTPTFLHAKHTIQACGAKRHVLCEKPMALSLAEADAMIQAAEDNGVTLMIAQVLRFWPEYAAMYKKIKEGDLGEPLHMTARRFGQPPGGSWQDWFLDPERSGTVVLDLHIHDLDFAAYLFGKPVNVSAVGSLNEKGIGTVQTSISFFGGKSASCGGGWLPVSGFPFTTEITIYCEKGYIESSSRAGVNIEARGENKPTFKIYRLGQETELVTVENRDGYLAEIEYYLGCLYQGIKPEVVTPVDARQSLQIALTARESLG